MSYFSDMEGLDLFTAPFGSPQTVKPKAPAQQPKAAIPQPVKTKAPETYSQPVKANPPMEQPQQLDVPQKPVPDKKPPALQKEQTKAVKPKPEQPSAQAQSKPSEKELTMDMSDHSIPVGNPLDASEDVRRKAHEEAEAKRKAEWEAKQFAKRQAEEEAVQKLEAMSDADVASASTKRIRADVERLTRRNMKECVSEHIQTLCKKDPAFARRTMHPKKSMVHCFWYINRMAKAYIQQEMNDNDIKPDNGVYGSDVPDDLCYKWAEDYFNDPDAEEDKENEEKFVSRPYSGTASKSKKTPKNTEKKKPEKKQEPKNSYEQMSFTEVL